MNFQIIFTTIYAYYFGWRDLPKARGPFFGRDKNLLLENAPKFGEFSWICIKINKNFKNTEKILEKLNARLRKQTSYISWCYAGGSGKTHRKIQFLGKNWPIFVFFKFWFRMKHCSRYKKQCFFFQKPRAKFPFKVRGNFQDFVIFSSKINDIGVELIEINLFKTKLH